MSVIPSIGQYHSGSAPPTLVLRRPIQAISGVILALGIASATVPISGTSARADAVLSLAAADPVGLETFSLADRSNNLRRLDNGDFMFRVAHDTETGVTYWAYMGSTKHVIAFAPDPTSLDDDQARSILLRVTDLPARVGCGVGLIHRSWVYIVPMEAEFGDAGFEPDASPLYFKGEVRNDVSGNTPVEILSFTDLTATN